MRRVVPCCEHGRLVDDVGQLRAREARGRSRDLFQPSVQAISHPDFLAVHLGRVR